MARPNKYEDGMLAIAEEYINGGFSTRGEATPTVVGLALAIGISQSTIYRWVEDPDHPLWDTVERCKDVEHLMLRNGGLTGLYNPTICKLMLHNFGHSDKVDTDVTSGGEPVQNAWHLHPTPAPDETSE